MRSGQTCGGQVGRHFSWDFKLQGLHIKITVALTLMNPVQESQTYPTWPIPACIDRVEATRSGGARFSTPDTHGWTSLRQSTQPERSKTSLPPPYSQPPPPEPPFENESENKSENKI